MKLRHISYIIGTTGIIGIVLMLTIQITSMETEPNDPNDIWLKWEQDYPEEMRVYDNSGYVEFSAGGDNEIVCTGTEKEFLGILYKSLSGKEPTEEVTLKFNEPNEPNEVWIIDPNYSFTVSDPNMFITMYDFTSDTLEMAGTEIYLKNMPLITKDEIRDFAIVIGAATARLYACDEFYEGLLKLVPDKLLQDPENPELNEPCVSE